MEILYVSIRINIIIKSSENMKAFLKEGNDANVTNISDYFRFLELAKNF